MLINACLAVATLISLTQFVGYAFQAPNFVEDRLIPDRAIQDQIRRTNSAYLDNQAADPHLNWFREVKKLLEFSVNGDRKTLIPQLAYYSAHSSKDLEDWAAISAVYQFLDLSGGQILLAIAPYISTEDESLRKHLRELLCDVERDPPSGPPNFSHYESYILAFKNRTHLALVEYMYERSPTTAALSMMNIYSTDREDRKALLWAEHVVSDILWKQNHAFLDPRQVEPDAVQQLDKLSRRPEWWIRLFVAAMLAQNPEFQVADMVGRLRNDEHPLVRKFAANAKEWSLRLPAQPVQPPQAVLDLYRELVEAEFILYRQGNADALLAIYDRCHREGKRSLELLLDVMYPESQPDERRYQSLGRFTRADDFLHDRFFKMHIDAPALLDVLCRRVLTALDPGRPVPKDLFMSSSIVHAIVASGNKEYIDRLRVLLSHPDPELARFVRGWMNPE